MDASEPPKSLNPVMRCVDDFTRRDPLRAVSSAFGVGFVLKLLPVGAIVTLLAGIAFSFARPALMFLGLVKVCELCGFRPYSASTSTPSEL